MQAYTEAHAIGKFFWKQRLQSNSIDREGPLVKHFGAACAPAHGTGVSGGQQSQTLAPSLPTSARGSRPREHLSTRSLARACSAICAVGLDIGSATRNLLSESFGSKLCRYERRSSTRRYRIFGRFCDSGPARPRLPSTRHTYRYAASGIAARAASCRYIQARMRGWSDIYEGVGLAVAQMIMYSSHDAVASYATRPRLRHFDSL